jgi:hypothetical protein
MPGWPRFARNCPPACARTAPPMPDGRHFLAAHGLTPERWRAICATGFEILRFIEQRFRQGIRISPQEIETYYHDTLLPQYAPGEAIPPLDKVSPRIEEILLQQQVNVLFRRLAHNLRKQGDVEVLDPALESPEGHGGAGNAPQGGGEEANEPNLKVHASRAPASRPRSHAEPPAPLLPAPSSSCRWPAAVLIGGFLIIGLYFWASSARFRGIVRKRLVA